MITYAANEPAGGAALAEVIGASAGALVLTALLLWIGFAHRTGRIAWLGALSRDRRIAADQPGWAGLPTIFATGSLLVALLGMYWDISLHIDVGRDAGPLANPAHYLILFGLFGIFSAGFLAMILPSREDPEPPPSAIRIAGDWRAPLGGVLIAACGAFSLIGFPLDDVWHRLFGQDVTLWGPTHLMLIGGAAMTLIGIAVLQVEGRQARTPDMRAPRSGPLAWEARIRRASAMGGLLIGLSTFQAEFDFGVPQFQLLFQPVLIAIAAGVTLVAARLWGGRGTAIGAVVFFIVVRGIVSVLVGPGFGETTPHLPLYLAEGLLVEAIAWRRDPARPYVFGAVAGALVGTVGLAAEWGWSHVWMPIPWPSALLPEVPLLVLAVGVAGGVLGAFIGVALEAREPVWAGAARLGVPLAGLVVAAVVALGLATTPLEGVRAAVALEPAGDGRADAGVRITPAAAAEDAEWLTITAWQGGGLVVDHLERTGPGEYRTTRPVPVDGNWKTMVRLHADRALMSSPVYMPRDAAIPAPEVPARPSGERPFVTDKEVLQREAKSGVSGALVLAGYGTVLAITLSLIGLLGWALARLSAGPRERHRPPAQPAAPRREAATA